MTRFRVFDTVMGRKDSGLWKACLLDKAKVMLMLGEESAMLNFDRVLHYAVRVSDRYDRKLSLVMMCSPNDDLDYPQVVMNHVRKSDEFLEFRDCVALLMGETNSDCALQAVKRLKRECGGKATDLRFGVASFPDDGERAGNLFLSARRRLEAARHREPGAVVAAG